MSCQDIQTKQGQEPRQQKQSFIQSIRQKYGSLIQSFLKFGLVGGSGFIVDMTVYTLLYSLFGVPHLIARGGSYWVSATWNWFWNRRFTFAHAKKSNKLTQWSKYLGMCLISFMPNWGTYYLLTTYIPFFSEYKQLALIAGVGCGMLFNFTIASLFVFSRSNENPGKEL